MKHQAAEPCDVSRVCAHGRHARWTVRNGPQLATVMPFIRKAVLGECSPAPGVGGGSECGLQALCKRYDTPGTWAIGSPRTIEPLIQTNIGM